MKVFSNVLDMVGRTPMLKVHKLDTGRCELFLKLELLVGFVGVVGLIEDATRADDRTLLLTESKIPPGRRETHPYRRFAEAMGFEYSNVEVVRHLPLPVPGARLTAWVDSAPIRMV